MGEVEPNGGEPHEVEHRVDGVAEGVGNHAVAVGSTFNSVDEGATGVYEFCEHHVVPEVEEMEQEAEHHDDAEHEHVLRCPFHLARAVGHGVRACAACLLVLQGEDDGIDEVEYNERGETDCSGHGVPVGAEHFAHKVVAFFREEGNQVHAAMEREEEDKCDTRNGHNHFSSNG